jgi:hypothetical protein
MAESRRVMESPPKRYFWYQVGYAHVRCVCAQDEDAARAAVLAREPHARGQRVQITPAVWRRGAAARGHAAAAGAE